MKDSRIGESLWFTWDGTGYTPVLSGSIIYYTEEHVDVDNELVRKALASSIQRDGIVESLGQAFILLNSNIVSQGYVGTLDDEIYQTVCSSSGETISGDTVSLVLPATWVEVLDF